MANYPVYQHPNIVKYPNPRQSVVNWASAGDKIMRGITEGVELGRKIKMQNEVLRVSKVTTARKQEETTSKLATDKLQQDRMTADYLQNYSAAAIRTDILTKNLMLQKVERETQANATLTQNDSMFNDMQVNATNIKLAMETTNDPSVRQGYLDQKKEDVANFQEVTGVELMKLAMSLQKDDPRAQQLAMLNPVLAQKQYLLDMLVPIQTSVLTQTDFDASDPTAMMMGKQSFDQSRTSTTMVPLSTARSYWQSGQSLSTFDGLQRNAADPALFDKWAKESGLGKLLEKAPVVVAGQAPAATAPTAELTALQTGEKVKFKINGKDVEVDQSLSDRLAGEMLSWPKTASIYKDSPIGKLVTPVKLAALGVSGISSIMMPALSPTIVNWVARGARVAEFRKLHTTAFKQKNLQYFEGQLEKLDTKIRALPETATSERNELGITYKQTRDFLTALKKDYGVAEDTTVDDAAANVTKGKALDDFPDEASARKAGKIKGDLVTINGRKARLN